MKRRRERYCTNVPKKKATATERKIPKMTDNAFSVFRDVYKRQVYDCLCCKGTGTLARIPAGREVHTRKIEHHVVFYCSSRVSATPASIVIEQPTPGAFLVCFARYSRQNSLMSLSVYNEDNGT